MPFQCSICDEPSTRICVRCTKDACDNHICGKCLKCSDCCECEVALEATPRVATTVHTPPAPEIEPQAEGESEPAPPLSEELGPEPDPIPVAEPSTAAPPALEGE
jgi:hypothetical protein